MRRRAFTLMEALLVLLLVEILLGILGGILWEYSKLTAEADSKDRGLATQTLLLHLQNEAQQAQAVLLPLAGASGSELRFLRQDPARSSTALAAGDRLPVPVPNPDPLAVWDAEAAAERLEIRFRVGGRQLFREVLDSSSTTTQALGQEIAGLRVEHLANGNLALELSSELEPGRIVTYRSQSYRWAP